MSISRLMRRVPIGGGQQIEVRAEAFNLLNTPSLGAPAAVLGAANVGTITSAGDPRVNSTRDQVHLSALLQLPFCSRAAYGRGGRHAALP
jgi:hypothetical protein